MRLNIILSEKPTPIAESFQLRTAEKIEKPWGHELVWAKTKDYVGKVLFVKANHSLSLQYHQVKEETLFLESGTCDLDTGPDEKNLKTLRMETGAIFHVAPGVLHRINAVTNCRFFEVSTPHLSDVVRLQDRYGRS